MPYMTLVLSGMYIVKSNKELVDKITEYLSNGGLFNPELMDHQAVRDLLIQCKESLVLSAEFSQEEE